MSWRRHFPVLVVQAESLGALGVIRSLGKAGYPVHAASVDPEALGLKSLLAARAAVAPSYGDPAFLPWLSHYVRSQEIRLIIPSESFLLAIRPVFGRYANLIPGGDRPGVLYSGMSKFDLFAALLNRCPPRCAEHLPPTLLVDPLETAPSVEALGLLGSPLYIKTDGLHARAGAGGQVLRASRPEQAQGLLRAAARGFRKAVVQGHVRGRGVGAFFLLDRGKVLAEMMHRRLHEVPHTGGVSSLRESWYHPGIREDALRKLRALGWQGVAMMEYRWDRASDHFWLLEMNGRFWGSLHLALYAGVDFPRLLADAFFGWRPSVAVRAHARVRCRHTFPGELQYVWSKLKDPAVSVDRRMGAIARFAALSVDPRVHADLLFPGDRALYWRALWQTGRYGIRALARARPRAAPGGGR